ncbi:MAG TPA: hypothetical protein VF169_15375 [Albitalea sp.]|uniref:hypothetical protein n=1 Tax=Piscinibacter sp. TaxID=1903157 RepID=UPI002ED1BEB6
MVDSIAIAAAPSGITPPTLSPVRIDADEARRFAAEIASVPTRSFDEMRASLLSQVDSHDPIRTMYAMTDVSIEAQNLSMKYSLATGLTSAVVGLFGTMLKSQQ